MFTTDSQIEANKERLEKLREELKDIQQINTLYLIYLGFVGIYFFDYTKKLITVFENQNVCAEIWFAISYSITLILLGISIYFFIRLLIPKYVAHDLLPKEVYNELRKEIEEWIEEENRSLDTLEETKLSYLETLEDAVDSNFQLYITKKGYAYKLILFAMLSIIPYILSILINTM
tara:strand:+ start:911 stop:1438 length:528 start_codon:yes stop_codon:yes gene_type:complete